ncbi:MAG: hypothetical protein WBG12_01265 [Xanthobacteraceae bacterium]
MQQPLGAADAFSAEAVKLRMSPFFAAALLDLLLDGFFITSPKKAKA